MSQLQKIGSHMLLTPKRSAFAVKNKSEKQSVCVSLCPSRLRKYFYQPKLNLTFMGKKIVTRSVIFQMNHCSLLMHLPPHPGIQNGIPGLGLGHGGAEGGVSSTGSDNEKRSKTAGYWVKTIKGLQFHPQE